MILKIPFRYSRFLFLLVALLILFFFNSFIKARIFGIDIIDIFSLLILFSGVYALSPGRITFLIGLFIAIFAFISDFILYLYEWPFFHFLSKLAYTLFFILIIIVILAHIMSEEEIMGDTIIGAVCVYLLIGMVWTMAFSLLEFFNPNSLFYPALNIKNENHFHELIYFSFTTLTTLGYGDIIPSSAPARMLSSMEAVIGQLYIAVMIARLVGLHIAKGKA